MWRSLPSRNFIFFSKDWLIRTSLDKKFVEPIRPGKKIGKFDVAFFAISKFHLFLEGLAHKNWSRQKVFWILLGSFKSNFQHDFYLFNYFLLVLYLIGQKRSNKIYLFFRKKYPLNSHQSIAVFSIGILTNLCFFYSEISSLTTNTSQAACVIT